MSVAAEGMPGFGSWETASTPAALLWCGVVWLGLVWWGVGCGVEWFGLCFGEVCLWGVVCVWFGLVGGGLVGVG